MAAESFVDDDVQMANPRESDEQDGENHSDWEANLAPYTGRARAQRLLFMAERWPQQRKTCASLALKVITASTKDVRLYHRALYIRNTSPRADAPALPADQLAQADNEWCEKTEEANRVEMEKLDLELRNYQNNMIKESIRMGYRDLADHLRATGNCSDALKYYMKTRDFCTTNENLVEMCINIVEVALVLKEYTTVTGYVNKAEGLLDSYNPQAAAASASSSKSTAANGAAASKGGSTSGADAIGALFRAGGSAGSSNANPTNFQYASGAMNNQREAEAQGKQQVQRIRSKLNIAQGLAFLGQGAYDQAARSFLRVEGDAEDAYSTMASRGDMALYLILCSLAVFDRAVLKSAVIDRPGIATVLGHDAHAQQLLDAFYACEYRRALSLLERLRTRSLYDIHLAAHYEALCRQITQRTLRQFVQPFETLSIERLAHSLGWQSQERIEQTVDELLYLIQKGQIDARLDVQRNILYVNKVNQREALYTDALEAGQRQTAAAKRVMLRVSLLQNGLVAKLDQGRGTDA